MSGLFLTDEEVDDMCAGLNRSAVEVRRPRALGIVVNVKPNGRPLIDRLEHVAGDPAGDAAQRLDGLADRLHVVLDLFPAVAVERHLALLVGEVDRHADVVWLALFGQWQTVAAQRDVRADDDVLIGVTAVPAADLGDYVVPGPGEAHVDLARSRRRRSVRGRPFGHWRG